MKALKWIALVLVALLLALALLVAAFLQFEPVVDTPPALRDHPNAQWSGGLDGGVFFEVIRSEPPRYYVEIRYESGELWTAGWVTHPSARPLKNTDFLGYYGGDTIDLKDSSQLHLKRVGPSK